MLKKRAEAARDERAAAAAPGNAGGYGAVRSDGFLDYPVNGYVTSPFGWRIHPIYGYRSLHDGVDFGAACGTPILAAGRGRVIEKYYQTAWGNRLIIDHGFHRGAGLAIIYQPPEPVRRRRLRAARQARADRRVRRHHRLVDRAATCTSRCWPNGRAVEPDELALVAPSPGEAPETSLPAG